jgi:hypothetical protein
MCKTYGKSVDKLRIVLGKFLRSLVEKFINFVDAWKNPRLSNYFYQTSSQVISLYLSLKFLNFSPLFTPSTATTKLKKGIE